MRLNRIIAQIDVLIYKAMEWKRALIPKLSAWHRFSVYCIAAGGLLLSTPFWTDAAVRIADAVADFVVAHVSPEEPVQADASERAEDSACECSEALAASGSAAWYHVPATYGGLLILAGLANYVFFAVILRLPFMKQEFISTSVLENETVEEFAARLAERRDKKLDMFDLTDEQKNTLLTPGKVKGNDLARMFLDALDLAENPALSSIHAIETRSRFEIGGPRHAKS